MFCTKRPIAALPIYVFKEINSFHIDKCKELNTEVKITQHNLPTMYWIPKLHKKPYKARFISYSRSCTTTNISIPLTSCLAKIKDHVELYCDKAYRNSGINLLLSIKNSTEVLGKLQNNRCLASTVSTSYPRTTLPNKLIKEKLTKLIHKFFARDKRLFLACNANRVFFTDEQVKH